MVRSLVYLSLLAILSFSPALCKKSCKKSDADCTTKAARREYPKFIKGIDAVPLKVDVISGNVNGMMYELQNSSLDKLNECRVLQLSFNVDDMMIFYNLACDMLILSSNYKVEYDSTVGMGTFKVLIDKPVIHINQYYNLMKKNGSNYIHIHKSDIMAIINKVKFEEIQSETNQDKANKYIKDSNDDGQVGAVNGVTVWLEQLLITFENRTEKYLESNPYETLF